MKGVIFTAKGKADNYERFLESAGVSPVTTLDVIELNDADLMILPGGGDIHPSFYGQSMNGTEEVDLNLDMLQFKALDYAIRTGIPVLGICRGFQLINVAMGGTLIQHIDTYDRHRPDESKDEHSDRHHTTIIEPGNFLYDLYGETAEVNSWHHQALDKIGEGLHVIQRCPLDNIPEAYYHEYLPIIGVQWHPERIHKVEGTIPAAPLLSYFLSLVKTSQDH